VTTFRDGSKEEGKYKNNVLITSQKKKHLFLIRSAKFRERIDAAVDSAQRASKYALQKADIAISRTATARGKAELADVSADHAKVDSEVAIQTAREFAPDFKPSLLERFERIRLRERFRTTMNDEPPGAKLKHNDNNQISQNQMTNNTMSPHKASQASQQQQTQAPQPQQQNLLNPQPTIRRTSVNPMMRQSSIDYTAQHQNSYANASSNPVDYSNSLGHNQQFGQPQPPGGGSSAFSTPQKFAQQQQNNSSYSQPTASVTVQQSQQHNQSYQPMNSHLQQQENLNSYAGYQQGYSDQQDVHASSRRNSRQVSDSGRPMLGSIHQTSIDHFDHYKRPPSRDSSVDRYSRAASRLGGGSRQPSVDRQAINVQAALNPDTLIDRGVRAGSQMRGTTPAPNLNGSVLTGSGVASRRGSRSGTPVFQPQPSIQTIQAQYSTPNQPFEDVLLRQRTLGQDIIPSPGQPKRTESLFVPNKPMPPSSGGGGGKGAGKVS
jgi:junctophilin